MGVQGKKRKKTIGKDFRYSVDKYKYSDFKSIYEVPLEEYDGVFAWLPDKEKLAVVKYCIYNKKHVFWGRNWVFMYDPETVEHVWKTEWTKFEKGEYTFPKLNCNLYSSEWLK